MEAGRRGAAAVELATLLAALVGVLLLTVEVVGVSMRGVYDSVAFVPSPGRRTVQMAAADAPLADVAQLPRAFLPLSGALLVTPALWLLYSRRRARASVAAESETVDQPNYNRLSSRRHELLNVLSSGWRRLFEDRLTVRDLASKHFQTVLPSARVTEVRRLLESVPVVLVCDRQNKLMGVIGPSNLLTVGATAKEIMDREPVTVACDAPLSPAITAMLERRTHCAIVMDGPTVKGVLADQDVMIAFQCAIRLLHRAAAGHDPGCASQTPSQTISGLKNAHLAEAACAN